MFVDEESAFWLLATLCEEMCPAYYSRSMNGAQADTMLLAELVEQRLPALHAHFEKVFSSSTNFLTCFSFEFFSTASHHAGTCVYELAHHHLC
jgi:hypothetical protein